MLRELPADILLRKTESLLLLSFAALLMPFCSRSPIVCLVRSKNLKANLKLLRSKMIIVSHSNIPSNKKNNSLIKMNLFKNK